MIYGLSIRALIEGASAGQAANAAARRSAAGAWRTLDEGRRLELVERALCPANDCERLHIAL